MKGGNKSRQLGLGPDLSEGSPSGRLDDENGCRTGKSQLLGSRVSSGDMDQPFDGA